MGTRQLTNLAKLLTQLVSAGALSLAVLRAAGLDGSKSLGPRTGLHFSVFFHSLLTLSKGEDVEAAFRRIASKKYGKYSSFLPESDREIWFCLKLKMTKFFLPFIFSNTARYNHWISRRHS